MKNAFVGLFYLWLIGGFAVWIWMRVTGRSELRRKSKEERLEAARAEPLLDGPLEPKLPKNLLPRADAAAPSAVREAGGPTIDVDRAEAPPTQVVPPTEVQPPEAVQALDGVDDPPVPPVTAQSVTGPPTTEPAAPTAPPVPPVTVPPVPATPTPPPAATPRPAAPDGFLFERGEVAPLSSAPLGPRIADLVSGISLPCDLVPLMDAPPAKGSRETVSFYTTSATIETVGPAIGDELKRLGFTLAPLSNAQALATKGADSLKVGVQINATPVDALVPGLPFPAAPADAVVVQFWLD